MEILLWQRVENLGERGDVVDVAPGYARNYLFRKGWATRDTESNRKQLKQKEESLKREEERRISQAQELREEIQNVFCVVEMQCNEEGGLFGSVNPGTIVQALENQYDISLDAKQIRMKEPIKRVGVYELPVKFHPEVQGKLHTWVVMAQ